MLRVAPSKKLAVHRITIRGYFAQLLSALAPSPFNAVVILSMEPVEPQIVAPLSNFFFSRSESLLATVTNSDTTVNRRRSGSR